MKRYSAELKEKIRQLRERGYTYSEIQQSIGHAIPKGTLTYICKDIELSSQHRARINGIIKNNSDQALKLAVQSNRQKHINQLAHFKDTNVKLADFMKMPEVQKIVLATLYLAEGAKWQKSRAPKLASSSPLIICLYIDLLKICYDMSPQQLHARVQCRADQDQAELIKFWQQVTGFAASQFYPCYVDKRTVGKPTTKSEYKGVCTIMSKGTHIQLELNEISSIIGEAMRGISSFG